MRKYYSILVAVLLASLSFSLTSCGDDDDNEPGSSDGGSIYFDGEKETITDATYEFTPGYGEVEPTFIMEIGGFSTVLEISRKNLPNTSYDTQDEYKNISKVLRNLKWLSVGEKIADEYPDWDISFIAFNGDTRASYISGNITVSSKGNDKVTLKFADYKFKNDGTQHTLSGTVTFVLSDNYFQNIGD